MATAKRSTLFLGGAQTLQKPHPVLQITNGREDNLVWLIVIFASEKVTFSMPAGSAYLMGLP